MSMTVIYNYILIEDSPCCYPMAAGVQNVFEWKTTNTIPSTYTYSLRRPPLIKYGSSIPIPIARRLQNMSDQTSMHLWLQHV